MTENGVLDDTAVAHIALLVNDAKTVAQDWALFLGCPLPKEESTWEYPVSKATYQGQPCDNIIRIYSMPLGPQVMLEIVQPDENPGVWRDYLDKHGEGFHHMAFRTHAGSENIVRRMEKSGFPLVQKGEWPADPKSGGGSGRYKYFDTFARLKAVVEVLEDDVGSEN